MMFDKRFNKWIEGDTPIKVSSDGSIHAIVTGADFSGSTFNVPGTITLLGEDGTNPVSSSNPLSVDFTRHTDHTVESQTGSDTDSAITFNSNVHGLRVYHTGSGFATVTIGSDDYHVPPGVLYEIHRQGNFTAATIATTGSWSAVGLR